MVDRSATSQGRSSYKLKSLSEDSGSRKKKAPREQYPTDTIDLVAQESVERVLPSNQIRKTLEVEVDHHDEQDRSESLGRPTFGRV